MGNGIFVERRSGQDRRLLDRGRTGVDRRSGGDRRQSGQPLETAGSLRGAVDRPAAPVGIDFSRVANGATDVGPLHSVSGRMRELLERGASQLTDIVAGFYDASLEPKLWPDVLQRLNDQIQADVCAIARHEFDPGRGWIDHSFGIDALYVTAYADFYGRDSIWLRDRERFSQPDAVWTSQDLIANGRLVETDFYKYWLRPQDLYHHLFGVIDINGSRVTYLMFGRSLAKGAFRRDDVELLRQLLPTLRRGIESGEKFKRLQTIQRIALDTLDAMPIGAILLDSGGAIVGANQLAREILESEESLFVGSAGLGVQLSGGRLKLRDLIVGGPSRSTERASEPQGFSLPRQPGHRAVTLLLVPVRDYPQAREREDPVAVLFVADPERFVQVDPRRLSRIYGLSRAEARVAALLASGKRLDDVAEALGLTYETVRKHLKQIFAKTGTERQADLVRTLSLGPCGLRL